jgi:choline kinase
MKAIILVAGIGSRLSPLTDTSPKSLLTVGGKEILERMIEHLQALKVEEIGMVTGYMADDIRLFVRDRFPGLMVTFIPNPDYLTTNTGYSLLLTRDFVGDDSCIKFDADVVFERAILEELLNSEHETALCIDRTIDPTAEEVKVKVDDTGRVLRAHKTVPLEEAMGESIGIEKIGASTAKLLFEELAVMMQDSKNHQEYYEGAYERLIEKGVPFFSVDITGMKWIEIDSHADYAAAQELFIA